MILFTPRVRITPYRFSWPGSPIKSGTPSGRKVEKPLDHDDAFAGFRQRLNHVASDVAGTAGDKHRHEFTIFQFRAKFIGCAVKSGVSPRVNWPLCLMLPIAVARKGA